MSEQTTIHIPAGYKPSKKEKYMNPMQIEYFRRKLIAWKEDLIKNSQQTIISLKEGRWDEPDPNDRASLENNTSCELRTRDRYRKLIDKINAALDRIANNEYGYCEVTDEPIGLGRLEARPVATLCIEAQEKHENYENSHNEEDEESIN